ncbi:hypothetical protein LINPERPRIM_LOCUS23830 [Linum perenne]
MMNDARNLYHFPPHLTTFLRSFTHLFALVMDAESVAKAFTWFKRFDIWRSTAPRVIVWSWHHGSASGCAPLHTAAALN